MDGLPMEMSLTPAIDIAFDFRQDTPPGKDPDSRSKTLRKYHKQLWSKSLPGGAVFELDDKTRGVYLHHKSSLGEFFLSSDAVIPTFKWNKRIQEFIPTEELNAFNAAGYTIGGMMVFPGNQIERKWTINQARGCSKRIKDRFDLTVECIRRYYAGAESPLSPVLGRYSSFFKLFGDFKGYVEFFLLQDIVSSDFSKVRFALACEDFGRSPIPRNADEYYAYRDASLAFIEARNQRIAALTAESTRSRIIASLL